MFTMKKNYRLFLGIVFLLNTIFSIPTKSQGADTINESKDSLYGISLLSEGGASPFDPYSISKPNVTLPSPEAVKVSEYNGYPVSPATGLIDINIPLINLDFYKVPISLSLSYHASGIRIQDEPGIAGLGWTILPGYRISRIVMGKPDDDIWQISQDIIDNMSNDPYCPLYKKIQCAVPASNCDDGSSGLPVDSVHYDIQPDIFTLSLPAGSANFIIENTSNGYLVKMINSCIFKIEPIQERKSKAYNVLLGFKVWDGQGNIYYFGCEDYKGYRSLDYLEKPNMDGIAAVTGFMLRKIECPQGTVSFSYVSDSYFSAFTSEYGILLDDGQTWGRFADNRSDYKDLTNQQTYYDEYYKGHETQYHVKLISSIESPLFKCDFEYEKGRVRSISVSNRASLNSKVKQITFEHSSDKMFLAKMFVSGEGYYQFTYNRQQYDLSSYAIDWWGYYNGMNQNDSNLPSIPVEVISKETATTLTYSYSFGKNANREPNEVCMKAKSLTSIKYPTGGTFTINYEANKDEEGFIRGGLRVKSTENYDPIQKTTTIKQYKYEKPHFSYLLGDVKDLVSYTKLCYAKPFALYDGDPEFWESYNTVRCRTMATFSGALSVSTAPVYYEQVTELCNDIKNKYYYTYDMGSIHYNLSYQDYVVGGYYPYIIKNYINTEPLQTCKETYDGSGSLMEKVNSYYRCNDTYFNGLYIVPYLHYVKVKDCPCSDANANALRYTNMGINTYAEMFGEPFMMGTFRIYGGINQIVEKVITQYTTNGEIQREETYGYNDIYPYLLSKKNIKDSQGGVYTELYYYPHELSSTLGKSIFNTEEKSGIEAMVSNNMLASVIEQDLEYLSSAGKSTNVWSKLTGYKLLHGKLVVPTKISVKKSRGDFYDKIKYCSYDINGNPTKITYDGVNEIHVTWNGMYPRTIKEGNQVTQYDYNPYVGLIKVTKPNGEVESYKYDSEQRLFEINDLNGSKVATVGYYRINK